MRMVLFGFVIGIATLQQRAQLPGGLAWTLGALVSLAALGWFFAGAIPRLAGTRESEPTWCARAVRWSRRHPASRWGALALAAALIGHGYAASRAEWRLREALPPQWEGRELMLRGAIRGLPAHEPGVVRFLLSVDVVDVRSRLGIDDFPSLVQLSWSQRAGARVPELVPGARWRLTVRLKRPHRHANFNGRDGEAALFARGVRATGYVVAPSTARLEPGRASTLAARVDRWRFMLAARIESALAGAPHLGIVKALAIGAQEAIDAADRTILRRTGTSHLVAISGLHIGFVAGASAASAAWLWRRSCGFGVWLGRRGRREWPLVVPAPVAAALTGTLCATGYAALAGFNVPAQRALWMLVVVTAAAALGRNIASSLVLAWAAALVLAADPWAVVAPGFWLSFCAVAVIALAMQFHLRRRGDRELDTPEIDDPLLPGSERRASWRDRWRMGVRRLGETLVRAARAQYAVTIGLAPLTAFWFSQISLAGPLANAFAVPWVSLVVTPVVLVAVALPAPLDAAAFELAHALLAPLMRLLARLSAYEWAEWRLARPSAWAMVSAAVGVLWCLMPRGWPIRFAAPLAWLPLALPPPAPAPGTFRLTALDVGQGAAILVETARHALLFDAGPGPESTSAGERIVVPSLVANGVRTLDALVLSHGDADHAGGAPAVLDAVPVRQLLGGLPPSNRLWALAQAADAPGWRCASGQRWRWDGVEFSVLWPDAGPLPGKSNAHSCVLRIEAPGFVALLTGDIDASIEKTLRLRAQAALRADVLLVAHHGSRTSSAEPFLDSVRPRIAIFQVGYRNRFGHPHPSVWARFAQRGIELARTDRDGAVRVELDAGVPKLERYRDTHRRYWMDRMDSGHRGTAG
jgi:competence protein ComEC